MRSRFLKSSRAKVADFTKVRERQSDQEFLRDLNIGNDPPAREVALAVRRAVAIVGQVDPLYIRADDRELHELSVLPLWDSMDWMQLLVALEEELSMKIPDKEAEKVRVRDFSVRSCISDLLPIVRRLRAAK
jgi:acyl carrier protein